MSFDAILQRMRERRAEDERRAAAGLPSLEEEEEQKRLAAEEARRAAIPTFTVSGRLVEYAGSQYKPSRDTRVSRLYVELDPSTPAHLLEKARGALGYTSVNLWGERADRMDENPPEVGAMLEVTGYFQKRQWNGPDGQRCFAHEITGREVRVLTSPTPRWL